MRLLLTIIIIVSGIVTAQEVLPHNLTEEERGRLSEIGAVRTITAPPDSILYAPAEFDSVAGVLFAWEGYDYLLKQLISETSELDTAWVVVDDANEQQYAFNQLNSFGANMDNVVFQILPTNSVWIRDYGPWWIYQPDGSLGIIDMVYNRPRPLDDGYPELLANAWGLDYYGTALVEAGGNLLLDGTGNALVSDIVFDQSQGFNPDSSLTEDLLENYLHDYFGVSRVIITPHLEYDGTGHIDMFVKILNDTTIIVGEYSTPSAAAGNNYNICNQVAAQLAAETNGNGVPYNIVRMLMPPYSGGNTYTYINSLIVNKKIYVPIYGFSSDSAALALYSQTVPDYEIIGFNCSQIISSNGAIHCISMKVPVGMEFEDPCGDWIMGDVNMDGNQDIMDVILLVDYILEVQVPEDCMWEYSDINGDEEINVLDVIILIREILEL